MQIRCCFDKPVIVDGAWIRSPYGYRTLDGVLQFHDGLDILGSNDDLLAIYDGEVFFSTDIYESKHDGTGCRTVVLKHKIGDKVLLVQYSHCNDIYVQVGDHVKKGQVIALMGWTGEVRPYGKQGKHLHVSMYYVDDAWKWNYKTRDKYRFDPQQILNI